MDTKLFRCGHCGCEFECDPADVSCRACGKKSRITPLKRVHWFRLSEDENGFVIACRPDVDPAEFDAAMVGGGLVLMYTGLATAVTCPACKKAEGFDEAVAAVSKVNPLAAGMS